LRKPFNFSQASVVLTNYGIILIFIAADAATNSRDDQELVSGSLTSHQSVPPFEGKGIVTV
jgi:hypothetical protein